MDDLTKLFERASKIDPDNYSGAGGGLRGIMWGFWDKFKAERKGKKLLRSATAWAALKDPEVQAAFQKASASREEGPYTLDEARQLASQYCSKWGQKRKVKTTGEKGSLMYHF